MRDPGTFVSLGFYKPDLPVHEGDCRLGEYSCELTRKASYAFRDEITRRLMQEGYRGFCPPDGDFLQSQSEIRNPHTTARVSDDSIAYGFHQDSNGSQRLIAAWSTSLPTMFINAKDVDPTSVMGFRDAIGPRISLRSDNPKVFSLQPFEIGVFENVAYFHASPRGIPVSANRYFFRWYVSKLDWIL